MSISQDARPHDAGQLYQLMNAALMGVPENSEEIAKIAASASDVLPSGSTSTQTNPSRTHHPVTLPSMVYDKEPEPARTSLTTWVMLSATGLAVMLMFSTVGLLVALLVFGISQQQKPTESAVAGTSTESTASEAETLRKRALLAIKDGNYELAVTLTTEALAISPETGDLKELLVIVTDLRDNRSAPRVESPPVASVAEPLPVPDRPAARPPPVRPPTPKPSAVQPELGAALITSTPSGLTFEILGITRGTTPFRATDLPKGDHTVLFYRDGKEVHRAQLNIDSGSLELLDVEVKAAEIAVAAPVKPPPLPQPAVSSGPFKLYVFVPTSVKPWVVESALAGELSGMNVSVFSSYRDFESTLRSSPPQAVMAPRSVLKMLNLSADLQGQDASGASTENYVLLSRKALSPDALGSATIGTVDIAGREQSGAFVAELLKLPTQPTIKRVSEELDLLPLLQFETVDGILLPQRAATALKSNTQMSLIEVIVPSGAALPAVSILDESRRDKAISEVLGLSLGANTKVGVYSWGR